MVKIVISEELAEHMDTDTNVYNRVHSQEINVVQSDSGTSKEEESVTAVSKKTICYKCGGKGHLAYQCPSPNIAKGQQEDGKRRNSGWCERGRGGGKTIVMKDFEI